jgi:hypothetical protein
VIARLFCAALTLVALGHMSAKAADDDAVRPEDRAAVAACLKIAAAACMLSETARQAMWIEAQK